MVDTDYEILEFYTKARNPARSVEVKLLASVVEQVETFVLTP
jgi:hypothetical protein